MRSGFLGPLVSTTQCLSGWASALAAKISWMAERVSIVSLEARLRGSRESFLNSDSGDAMTRRAKWRGGVHYLRESHPSPNPPWGRARQYSETSWALNWRWIAHRGVANKCGSDREGQKKKIQAMARFREAKDVDYNASQKNRSSRLAPSGRIESSHTCPAEVLAG